MRARINIGVGRSHRASGWLAATAVLAVLPTGLEGATLFGRVRECGNAASAAGFVVQGFEVVRTGSRVRLVCEVSEPVTRHVGTATTDDAGNYAVSFTPTEDSPFLCFFERAAFIQVFSSDGTTLLHTSPQKPIPPPGTLERAFDTVYLGSTAACSKPHFILSAIGPSTVSGFPGTKASFEAMVLLDTEYPLVPTFYGAQGWIVNVAAERGTVVSATHSGTLAALDDDDPPGIVRPCGFRLLEIGASRPPFGSPECANLTVAQSGANVCGEVEDGPDFGLPLEGALPSILIVTVEVVMPAAGAETVCRVFFPEGCAVIGNPVGNVGLLNNSLTPVAEKRELRVTLNGDLSTPPPVFRRADANGSGEVDISDAVNTFGFLFLGDKPPLCLSAADSNGDGAIDISDGVNTLSYLFTGGSSIPTPGPLSCGAAPDSSRIGCASYSACD
jgi:hypothetical protein